MLPTTSPEVFRLPSSFFKFSLHILPPCSSFTGPHRPTLPYSISDHKYEAPLTFRHAHLRHSYLHSQRDSNRAPGLFPTQPLLLSHFAHADTCCNCPLVFSCAAFEPPLFRLCAYLPPRRHLPRAAPEGPPAPTSTPPSLTPSSYLNRTRAALVVCAAGSPPPLLSISLRLPRRARATSAPPRATLSPPPPHPSPNQPLDQGTAPTLHPAGMR